MNWKPIPDYEGLYEISTLGNVFSIKTGRIRAPSIDSNGYYRIHLWKKNKGKSYSIHSLVLKTFLGIRPDGYDINHKDGNRLNNELNNLEYITRSQNELHKNRILQTGNRISDEIRQQIYKLKGHYTQTELERLFSIDQTTISKIFNGV